MNEWMGKNFAYETETVYCSDIKPKVFSTEGNFLEASLADFSLLFLSIFMLSVVFSSFSHQNGKLLLCTKAQTIFLHKERNKRKTRESLTKEKFEIFREEVRLIHF